MTIEREHYEATQSERIKREFKDREEAERAVKSLREAGFRDNEITLETHGGNTLDDGTFVPGGLVLVVITDPERAKQAERVLS